MPKTLAFATVFTAAFAAGSALFAADASQAGTEAIISVKDQRMLLLRDGGVVAKFPVSTSRFGTGDSFGSYKTPLGRLRICEKIGGELPEGAVLKHQQATGEVLPPNAPGRDPIVSRILWLEGTETQNENARGRKIYIHGTTEEKNIGKSVSWGCIRMRSKDVVKLYETLPVGACVVISTEKIPHLPKYVPPPVQPAPAPTPVLIASANPAPAKPAPAAAKPASAPARTAAPEPVATSPTAAHGKGSMHTTRLLTAAAEPTQAPELQQSSRHVLSLKTSMLYSGLPEADASEPWEPPKRAGGHATVSRDAPSEAPQKITGG